jgi:putative ABC transport system substrate-binding protein
MTFGPVGRGGLAGSHEGFLQGLLEHGYAVGQNVVIEYRHASNRAENLPQAARELVDLNLDAIVALGAKDVDALLKLSRTVPIVTVYVSDPVRLGYAESLARPARNVTGLTTLAGDLTVKWLEILKELRPGLASVGALWDLGMGAATNMDAVGWRPEDAFKAVGLRRHIMAVRDVADLDAAFEAARRERVGAVLLGPSSGLFRTHIGHIAQLATKHRWPGVADLPVYAEGGLLLAYGADIGELFRRAATHVVKILKGTRAGDIPIEQPTKFTIVANLNTARAMDLVLPQSLLARLDRAIQ